MANELQPLSLLFQNRLFRIPDYQRGYAWLQQQLVDFGDDLVNLQTDRYHYTGLLSLKPLKGKNNIDRFCTWSIFTKSKKDKVSIEHILPQTPTKYYWRNMYRQFKDSEIKVLSGALGNLLPLSQSVN